MALENKIGRTPEGDYYLNLKIRGEPVRKFFRNIQRGITTTLKAAAMISIVVVTIGYTAYTSARNYQTAQFNKVAECKKDYGEELKNVKWCIGPNELKEEIMDTCGIGFDTPKLSREEVKFYSQLDN